MCMWSVLAQALITYGLASISIALSTTTTTNGYSYASNPLTMTTSASRYSNITGNVSPIPISNISDAQPTTQIVNHSQAGKQCSGDCDSLSANCYDCNTTNDCVYGDEEMFSCSVKKEYHCFGSRNVKKVFRCTYCYLLKEDVDYTCTKNYTNCNVKAAPPQRFNATCTVNPYVFCLGRRTFIKASPCNWTAGYKWYTALALSITLGGFGADRFYLGYWKEALGKLFSFGGLGVWTLIDIVLIGTSYLMPADGSLYIS